MTSWAAFWSSFWLRLMSPQTARFVLALASLALAGAGAYTLLTPSEEGETNSEAAIFAIGQLFALATMAFGYYFGSTARNDDRPQETKIVNTPTEPVPTSEERPHDSPPAG